MRVTELHTGLSEITAASYSSSAQRLYVISHVPSRSSLLRFDAQTGEFRHVLPGVSGVSLDYSKDRQWVTYTSSEDDSLWVSRADGGGARELFMRRKARNCLAGHRMVSGSHIWRGGRVRLGEFVFSRALEAQSARRRKATILEEPPLGRLMEIILSMEMSGVRQRALAQSTGSVWPPAAFKRYPALRGCRRRAGLPMAFWLSPYSQSSMNC